MKPGSEPFCWVQSMPIAVPADCCHAHLQYYCRFAPVYTCEAGVSIGAPLEQSYMRVRCEATLQILGDMEVLARADYFVSSYHSR